MRYLILLTTSLLALGACGGNGDTDDADDAPPDPTPTQTVTQELTQEPDPTVTPTVEPEPTPTIPQEASVTPTPRVDPSPALPEKPDYEPVTVGDDITVLFNSASYEDYRYSGAAVFWVTNPNSNLTAVDLPYRVTYYADGEPIHVTDGNDMLTVAPGSEYPVVHRTGSDMDTEPDDAEIRIYDEPNRYVHDYELLADSEDWELTNPFVQCGDSFVSCEVLGDLTWHGELAQTNIEITVLVYEGDDTSGPIVAAMSGFSDTDWLRAGQTMPFTARVTGFDQPEPGRSAVAPDNVAIEVHVQSLNVLE